MLGQLGPRNYSPPWELAKQRPYSISGVALEGFKLVRQVFMDESGISAHEPIAVVAGIVIDADRDLNRVEQYLESLVNEFVPKEHRSGFVFRATKLFHKSSVIPPEKSHDALKAILMMPALFQLTVVFGYVRKMPPPELPPLSGRKLEKVKRDRASQRERLYHAMAFSECAVGVESFMQRNVDPEEVTELIAENNTNTQTAVKQAYNAMKGRNLSAEEEAILTFINLVHPHGYLPLRKIKHVPLFAKKDEVSSLQIADACAMVVRRSLEDRQDIYPFEVALTSNQPEKLHNSGQMKDPEFPGGFNILNFYPPA